MSIFKTVAIGGVGALCALPFVSQTVVTAVVITGITGAAASLSLVSRKKKPTEQPAIYSDTYNPYPVYGPQLPKPTGLGEFGSSNR